jgi:hypothetical protein
MHWGNTIYLLHKVGKNGSHMNDACIEVYNPIFEALQEVNTRQRRIHIMKEGLNPAQKAIPCGSGSEY